MIYFRLKGEDIMNNIGLLLFLAIFPVILILLFVYNKDKSKEPIVLLLQLSFGFRYF